MIGLIHSGSGTRTTHSCLLLLWQCQCWCQSIEHFTCLSPRLSSFELRASSLQIFSGPYLTKYSNSDHTNQISHLTRLISWLRSYRSQLAYLYGLGLFRMHLRALARALVLQSLCLPKFRRKGKGLLLLDRRQSFRTGCNCSRSRELWLGSSKSFYQLRSCSSLLSVWQWILKYHHPFLCSWQ